jgi:hypothetical protein
MAVSAPDKDVKSPAREPLVPPDEQFWKRYSPHGEAPLSMAGSITLHALAVGLLVLFAAFVVSMFDKSGTLPVEPVRLAIDGGGGGKPTGVGDGKGIGNGPENIGEPGKEPQLGEEDAPRRPSLDPKDIKKLEEHFDPADARRIARSETGKAIARLDESVRRKLSDGMNPGHGQGGTGSGGGKGTGRGTGEGPGEGPGKARLSKREKRMLRWHITFSDVKNGSDHLAQLRALGAILVFPVKEGDETQFKVVRDLRPGGELKDEDVSNIHLIWWVDDKQQSVNEILRALGARLPVTPRRFIVFLPQKLEESLFEMERNYVEKVLRQKFDEDRIEETTFRIVRKGGTSQPETVSVTVR